MSSITSLWSLLKQVKSFSYTSECGVNSRTGWQGAASGTVQVEIDPAGRWIHFYERCDFTLHETGTVFDLKNQYRWTLNEAPESIRLEHWRRGSAVHLVDLVPVGNESLKEAETHLCVADHYGLSLELREWGFDAVWRITGPKKDETLRYVYRIEASE